jgi:hypothetical protein
MLTPLTICFGKLIARRLPRRHTQRMTRYIRLALPLTLSLALAAASADAARRARQPHTLTAGDAVVVTEIPLAEKTALQSAWTQLGPGGVLEARAVVTGEVCPLIFIDLQRSQMQQRAAADGKFPKLCWAALPAGTRQAALAFPVQKNRPPSSGAAEEIWKAWIEKETGIPLPGPLAGEAERQLWRDRIAAAVKYDTVPLPLSVSDPTRIVVFGDSGCRIKGELLQDCRDSGKWPFARIAAEAARLKPDLVLHVGDYVSREMACPANAPVCTGMPYGDNWQSWNADFFAPATPLLAAAPWVIVRGNHEDCSREGSGWLRLLGPAEFDPAAPCNSHVAPYSIPLERQTLVVMDDSSAPEQSLDAAMIPVFRQELAALAGAKAPAWLLLHRPIWAPISGPLGIPVGGSQTMIAAAGKNGLPPALELMLSGHIHSIELINYEPGDHVPPQIVAGSGGDLLTPTPTHLRGTVFQGDSGVQVADGVSLHGFGFLLMTRMEGGWRIDVYDPHGQIERQCFFRNGRLGCPVRR